MSLNIQPINQTESLAEDLQSDDDVYSRRKRTPQTAAGVPIAGWSGAQDYNVNTLLANPEDNGAFTVQAEFKEITYYTVQFSISITGISGPGAEFFGDDDIGVRGLVEIHWTVKGNHHQRILHVTNGTTISGSGESVWVKFRDTSHVRPGEDNVIVGLVAKVAIVTGTRPTAAGAQPPMLMQETAIDDGGGEVELPDQLASGGTFFIQVPVDCGVNAMMVNATRANALEILGNEVEIRGLGGPNEIFDWGAIMCNKWVPLPPGTNAIEITNNDPAEDITIGVIWGIEG